MLVLNSGSSSQKTALFELGADSPDHPVPPLWEGKLQWDGDKQELQVRNHSGQEIRRESNAGVHRTAVQEMLDNLWSGPTAVLKSRNQIQIAGHRIVHGGSKLVEPMRVTSEVKREIESTSSIAPLHNKAELEGIEMIEDLLPAVPQVAVFDTGFHRTLPPEAFIYPVPYDWYAKYGIRRYGFHGINHEYCANRAARLLRRDIAAMRMVTCHLGNGCSLCAIAGGNSVDTTMGFTPLEGLVMGTRSGSIDPGILLYLCPSNRKDSTPGSLDHALNHESGLLGISGVSSDMRDILGALQRGNKRAQLAFDVFIHRLVSGIGAMAASLGGLDALIFTAGIGENSPEVRRATCDKLGFLGIQLDRGRNSDSKQDTEISSSASKVRVLIIRAQEDWAIARKCVQFA